MTFQDEPHSKLKTLVQREFNRRLDKNPSYSLRSFAKQLDLDPSSLSKFLRGQRKFTQQTALKVMGRLKLSDEQICQVTSNSVSHLKFLEYDQFRILSTWYYTSLLEAIELDDFIPDEAWLADKLNLTLPQVRLAVETLTAHGAIQITEDGQWVNNWQNCSTASSPHIDESPLREYQKQLRTRAIESIDNDPIEEKDHTSYELVMDEDLFEDIRAEIAKFRRRIARRIENESVKKDKVVNLQISFFYQTKKDQGEQS